MADDTGPINNVGGSLRRLRRWRGMDQATLSGLVGRSQGWVSRVESGRLRLDRQTDIEAVAEALQVHPSDITGRPHLPGPGRAWPIEALIPAVRVALVDDVFDAQLRPVVELERRVKALARLMWQDGDLAGLAAALPELLGDVRLASMDSVADDDRRRALQLLSVVCSVAFPMLKNLGHTDLALVASTRSVAAAEELGDPLWRAYAGFRRSHALIPAGSPTRALAVIGKAVDELQPHVTDEPAILRMYGMAHLTAALWASRAGESDTTAAHMVEAQQAAGRVGTDGEWFDITFGPAQVAIHHVGNAARLGEGGQVEELASKVDTTGIRGVHLAMFAANVGHGLGQVHRGDEAVRAFRRAERLSPQRMRTSQHFRSLVLDTFGQPMRPASLRDLRGLAYRTGSA